MNGSTPDNWYTYSFRAMGSEIEMWLEASDVRTATVAFKQGQALFEANEQALSRFRPGSELSHLNALSGRWVVVSDLLWDVLTKALQMAGTTNGHFDPTMLNALEQTGYTINFEQLTQVRHKIPMHKSPSFHGKWTAIELDEANQSILLPVGVRLDLGGIAKGYTAQETADLLGAFGPCLVNAGGDLVAGTAPEGYPGWPVAISAPTLDIDQEPIDLCSMWLAQEALATSGIDYRTWELYGRQVHHLMDPDTGAPAATDGLTVTVQAEDAAQAEAWATATLVAGSGEGMDALREAGLAGLMVTQSGVVIVTPLMHQRLQLLPA